MKTISHQTEVSQSPRLFVKDVFQFSISTRFAIRERFDILRTEASVCRKIKTFPRRNKNNYLVILRAVMQTFTDMNIMKRQLFLDSYTCLYLIVKLILKFLHSFQFINNFLFHSQFSKLHRHSPPDMSHFEFADSAILTTTPELRFPERANLG